MNKPGTFEYVMTEIAAKEYLKKMPKKYHPNEYLCEVINTEFGIKGICTKVVIE